MKRRIFLQSLAGAGLWLGSAPSEAQVGQAFDALLAEIQSNAAEVEAAWSAREPQIAQRGVGRRSDALVSQRALDMIIAFEVANPAAYTARYSRPIWPRGQSGVTIGIGYDLAFVNEHTLRRDWGERLDEATIETLRPALGLHGRDASAALASVQSVSIPWDAALSQFQAYMPYEIAKTEDVFANTQELSEDSRGALVSLVYNRGTSMARRNPRRREMREIRDFMAAREFQSIPGKIRDMKRIWEGNPDARGLLRRRDMEALLFESGLESMAQTPTP